MILLEDDQLAVLIDVIRPRFGFFCGEVVEVVVLDDRDRVAANFHQRIERLGGVLAVVAPGAGGTLEEDSVPLDRVVLS